MAKKLRVGDSIRGYRVTKIFGPGMMAISYAAEGPGGLKVFLKQYKSPSPAVIWYPQFVDYQQELSRRVRDGKAARLQMFRDKAAALAAAEAPGHTRLSEDSGTHAHG